jgi:hypothetical protein
MEPDLPVVAMMDFISDVSVEQKVHFPSAILQNTQLLDFGWRCKSNSFDAHESFRASTHRMHRNYYCCIIIVLNFHLNYSLVKSRPFLLGTCSIMIKYELD